MKYFRRRRPLTPLTVTALHCQTNTSVKFSYHTEWSRDYNYFSPQKSSGPLSGGTAEPFSGARGTSWSVLTPVRAV